MPTKRQRKTRNIASRITEDAHLAWKAGDAAALHRALRLPPWQVSPLFATGECPWPAKTAGASTWDDSVSLRRELESCQ